MSRIFWKSSLILALSLFAIARTQSAAAQGVVVYPVAAPYYRQGPAPSYYDSYYNPPVAYAPIQRASYYSAPPVAYAAPSVSYYPAPPVAYAAPAVSYYSAPPVAYAAPTVSYYSAPAVAYAPPAVSYYPAPVAAVTTTRYGIFGQPRQTSTYYYPR